MNLKRIDTCLLRIAYDVGLFMSKDTSTQVGALVATPDYRQISTGYNGFPKGVDETSERITRPEKYEWVIHAEENALLNAPFDTKGCTMYCSLMPCYKCLGKMINAGIENIVYLDNPTHPRLFDNREVGDELIKHFKDVRVYDKRMIFTLANQEYKNENI